MRAMQTHAAARTQLSLEGVRPAHPHHPRRRRPDRAHRGFGDAFRKTRQEVHLEDLSGRDAQPGRHEQGAAQPRPVGVHQGMTMNTTSKSCLLFQCVRLDRAGVPKNSGVEKHRSDAERSAVHAHTICGVARVYCPWYPRRDPISSRTSSRLYRSKEVNFNQTNPNHRKEKHHVEL